MCVELQVTKLTGGRQLARYQKPPLLEDFPIARPLARLQSLRRHHHRVARPQRVLRAVPRVDVGKTARYIRSGAALEGGWTAVVRTGSTLGSV